MNYSIFLHLMCLLVTITTTKAQKYQNNKTIIGDNNISVGLGKITGLFLQNCWLLNSYEQQQNIFPILQNCLKHKALAVLTKTFQRDTIKIFNGIEFVKNNNREGNLKRRMEDSVEESDWENQVLQIITEGFKTHTLRIHLENLLKQDTDLNKARNRHRRRGNSIMPFMLFGVVAMGMLLIPMGFKFLTVLGAKALLLAKMALILTSIQGLKRVATSGINYGLYHSPNSYHSDRHGLDDIPDEQLDFMDHKFMRT